MKVFRNNKCYVDFMDLVKEPIPDYFKMEDGKYEQNALVIIEDQESINYLKKREDIINYDEVCNLNENELNEKIKRAFYDVVPYEKKWRETPSQFRYILTRDKEFMKEFKLNESIFNSLIDYKCNKKEIDTNISLQTELNIKKLEKRHK